MSRTTKIVLIVVGVLLVLCVGGACGAVVLFGTFANKAIVKDPAKVADLAHSISDYDLPSGYREQIGMNILNSSFVIIGGSPSRPMIMLMQFPAGEQVDQATMEIQMQQAMQQSRRQQNQQLIVVGHRTVSIRGQEVDLTISEGRSSNSAYRQETGIFQGKGGPTMLMIIAPSVSWDQGIVDSFLASMR